MRDATLIATGAKPVIRFERFLPRPLADVWRAMTDPVEMRTWFPTRIEVEHWEAGACLLHHFDDQPLPPLPGRVLECVAPRRLVFTWGDDTIGFELSEAEGGTLFVLTEELAPSAAARNAAGWEVCLDRLVDGMAGPDRGPRFAHYAASFTPLLGPQEGPPGEHG